MQQDPRTWFPVSVAPMIDRTDRHCRFFFRLFSRDVRLYTEMVTAAAIVHGDAARLLEFNPTEHPVALQIAGCEPRLLEQASRAGAQFGYDEINLNLGCPSPRVQAGRFGACLMREPVLVNECLAAMVQASDVGVSAKIRLGVDDLDNEQYLHHFVERIVAAGCRDIIVHARKALLDGLTPKENREIPPLRYDAVYSLKKAFPDIRIQLNGGVQSLADIVGHLRYVDGVMVGRKAYEDPCFLGAVQAEFVPPGAAPLRSRGQIVEEMMVYLERELLRGTRVQQIARHMAGLFHGAPGARHWRRVLSENSWRPGVGAGLLRKAFEQSLMVTDAGARRVA
jgi:tRNA-dihydrouridine synthase A